MLPLVSVFFKCTLVEYCNTVFSPSLETSVNMLIWFEYFSLIFKKFSRYMIEWVLHFGSSLSFIMTLGCLMVQGSISDSSVLCILLRGIDFLVRSSIWISKVFIGFFFWLKSCLHFGLCVLPYAGLEEQDFNLRSYWRSDFHSLI